MISSKLLANAPISLQRMTSRLFSRDIRVHSLSILLRGPRLSSPPLGFEYIPRVSYIQLLSHWSTIDVEHTNKSVLVARPSLGIGAQGFMHRHGPRDEEPGFPDWPFLTISGGFVTRHSLNQRPRHVLATLHLIPPYCSSDVPCRGRPPRLPTGPWSSFRFASITESVTSPQIKHFQQETQSDDPSASSNRMVTINP